MSFLEVDESVRLQTILKQYPGIGIDRQRPALLKVCGIYHLLGNLEINGGVDIFAESLLAELQNPHLTIAHGYPAIIALLKYIRLKSEVCRLSAGDIQFLDKIMER